MARLALPKGEGFNQLPADLCNLTLQGTNAGFAGIVPDDIQTRGFGNVDLANLQPIEFGLLRNEVTLRNAELFVFRITRNADDFHAVQQWPGDIHGVRSADKHHV